MRLGVVLAANFWGKTKTVTQTVVIILIWIFELILYRAPMIKPEVRIIEMILIGITGAVSVLSILCAASLIFSVWRFDQIIGVKTLVNSKELNVIVKADEVIKTQYAPRKSVDIKSNS
jgi:hypothetical protein